jgi:K+-sensing histidine kinase KdpD
MTVVAGYIRMLLKDRAGPITDPQRRLLEEAEKSCGRLTALLAEVSDLANLESGTATLNRSALDLRELMAETIASLPAMPDREVNVKLSTGAGAAVIQGDRVRLKSALTAILNALRREVVSSDCLFVREQPRDYEGRPSSWIAVADPERIDTLALQDIDNLTTFDEWRGGCGLSLAVARRVITAHFGRIWSPIQEAKAAAVVVIPHQ